MNKQIEQILDEIERQLGNKEETSNLDNEAFNSGRWKALEKLKDFINTQSEEHINEERDIDMWLEEYKSRTHFYKNFIEYLSEECVGSKDNIIEAVNNNFRNEFIGYVDTEKEIDKKGNLIFKFKIDDKPYKAHWQENDNYAVCQWTGYEADDYMGYLLFPTWGFKKFFCIYYTC